MKFDPLRAFPYPVLRPDVDDYMGADIISKAFFKPEGEDSVRIDVSMNVGVPELRKLVKDKKARYETVIKCRETYEQHKMVSFKPDYHDILPSGYFTGKVTINTYLVATSHITGFTSPMINPEFGNGPFEFNPGSLLSVYRTETADVSREAFKPLSACFRLEVKDNLPDWQSDIAASGHTIQVLVNKKMRDLVIEARTSPKKKAIVIGSIYTQVVQQSLSLLRNNPEEYEDYRWANIFGQRAKELGTDIKAGTEMSLAQTLMATPFSLIEKYHFQGDKND